MTKKRKASQEPSPRRRKFCGLGGRSGGKKKAITEKGDSLGDWLRGRCSLKLESEGKISLHQGKSQEL